jgi:hypothetical protein
MPEKTAMPHSPGGDNSAWPTRHDENPGAGFPQFTRFAVEGFPPLPPFLMSPLLCR